MCQYIVLLYQGREWGREEGDYVFSQYIVLLYQGREWRREEGDYVSVYSTSLSR